MWAFIGIIAAVLLGIYDIFKKTSLNNNAVLPVLLISIASSSLFFYFPLIIGSKVAPNLLMGIDLFVPQLTLREHLLILIKSFIVLSSWILAFFAVKHLPLTIVTPIRASAPLWTLMGALIIFSEKLNLYQWVGLLVTLTFFTSFQPPANSKASISGRTNGFCSSFWQPC